MAVAAREGRTLPTSQSKSKEYRRGQREASFLNSLARWGDSTYYGQQVSLKSERWRPLGSVRGYYGVFFQY